MNKFVLSGRHKRLLSSMLFVVEKKIDDINDLIHNNKDHASYTVVHDMDSNREQEILNALIKARDKIKEMVDKYGIKQREIKVSSYIHTLESQMWEMLTDSLSGSLKGYGKEIVQDAKMVDEDVSELMRIIESIKPDKSK